MLQAATHENRAEGMQKFFAQFKRKFLIGGNFNGHHLSWGNLKNCTIGNNLYHCITEFQTNFTLLNDGSQTHISYTTGSKAALDLTFVDPRSALLYTWKVGRDPWKSDHYPIFIEYNGIIEQGNAAKRLLDCIINTLIGLPLRKKLKVKTHNGWNRERDVKERYENSIQIIKGKLEETTLKKNLGNGGQGKIRTTRVCMVEPRMR
jgi:hypothetical protein